MVNGTLVWYYTICKRQVWLMGHGIGPDQKNDNISFGRYLHSFYFKKENLKEVMIDNSIKIDLVRGRKVVAEIKKSSKYLESTKYQLLFYLYYLKKSKGVELEGEILIPEERRKIAVKLSEEKVKEVEEILKGIEDILKMDKPPRTERIKYCKKCGYKEICWV